MPLLSPSCSVEPIVSHGKIIDAISLTEKEEEEEEEPGQGPILKRGPSNDLVVPMRKDGWKYVRYPAT